MSNKNLELALRLKAEFDDAKREINELDRGIAKVGDTAQTTGAKLDAQNKALQTNTTHLKLVGQSAKQTQAAMRLLPAQITDVVTSLASGSPAWLVAIQQGGQVKDSFGGIGNAAKALTSLLNPMTLAIGAVAAAAAAGALAYKQGSDEADGYNRALIMTGNVAGTNADQMATWADRIDQVAGTHHAAAEALAEVTSRGKFTGEQILQIGQSAELMRVATGRAVSETADEFEALAKDPVDAIAKLNDKYHFLTLEVYQQIEALKKQGNEVDAVKLAIDAYSGAMDQRSTKIVDNLGSIERAWKSVKSVAAETWDALLGIGRSETIDERLKEAQDRLASLQADNRKYDFYGNKTSDKVAAAQRAVDLINAQKAQQQSLSDREGAEKRLQDNAITAQREIDKQRQETLTKAEKKEKEIADYRRNVEKVNAAKPGSIGADQQKKDIANIEEKYKDPATKKDPRESTFATLNKQITERIALLQAATDSETKLTDAQKFAQQIQASLADGTTKLTAAQRSQIETRLKELDTIDKLNQAKQDEKALADVRTRLLAAQGQNAQAATARIEKEYADLIERLKARGDTAGLELVKKLINVQQAKGQLSELQSQVDRIFGEQSRQENSIQAQQQSGLISEIGARQKIIDLHAATAAEVEKLLPQMEQLAAATGDPGATERVKDLRAQLADTKLVANELTNALRSGFESGLSNALVDLANGTASLQEAALSFVQSMTGALAELAAQKLAAMAVDSVGGLFSAGSNAVADTAATTAQTTAITTAGATAGTAMGTGITTAGSTVATGIASAIASAGEIAAGRMAAAIIGAQAADNTADTLTTVAAVAAATGGQVTGPGTGTSDSIPAWLSNEEFVTRAAVTTQPGALAFLHDFNARGMAALGDWSLAVRHATGGLAGIPAPAMGSPSLSTATLSDSGGDRSTTIKNAIDLHVYDDPQRIADSAFNTRQGKDAFYLMLSRDPAKVRSLLNI